MKGRQAQGPGVKAAEAIAARVAAEQGVELVEATLKKEPQGWTLCIYIDTPAGVTLDDCERFHRAVQPLLESVEYDYLEVSSPGVDRPVETPRDFEKNRGVPVEVKLYAPLDGAKRWEGLLSAMDEASVTITLADGSDRTFARKAVAIVKPVIDFALDPAPAGADEMEEEQER